MTIDGASAVAPSPIGQSGTVSIVQQSSSQWHSVAFDATIDNAVVVMGPMTSNGDQPGTTRIRNVTDTGFEFQIDEWDYLDGSHIREDIGWLAISEGSHTLAGGQTIVAGTQSIGTDFTEIGFGEILGEAVVLAEVASVNEDQAVTTRIRRVDGDSFEVSLQEEEESGAHVDETISWIAVETGTADGLDVFRTADQLNHAVDTFLFQTDFSAAPVLLADLQSFDGRDTAVTRMSTLDGDGVGLFVDEEQSRDSETRHTNETAGYVALTEGLIFDDLVIV